MTDSADTESARRQALAALIEDVRIARRAGGFVDNQTLVDAHPELMPELAAELDKLQRIETARRAAELSPEIQNSTHDMPLPDALLNDLEKPTLQIPGYSILRELSRGGQAAVYLATQLSTGRKIALKLMHDGPFASDRALTRFRREVQSLAALNHPNIVAIIDTGRTPDGSRFIAMNYIAGANLSDYMKDRYKKDSTDPAKLLRLFLKICDAVNAAHRLGIIHRDLKPSNIRVDERGEPHILDFGLARTALDHALPNPDHAISVTGEFLGSLPWSSPEQAEGNPEKIDIRTDVYSLGVILYQILTNGRFPYEVVGNIRDILNNILTADPTPPSKIVPPSKTSHTQELPPARTLPTINEAIEKIVLKALAKKPENRYRSAGDLGRDIARYLAGHRTAARVPDLAGSPVAATTPLSKKKYLRVSLATAVAAIIVLSLAFSLLPLAGKKNAPPSTAPIAENAISPAPTPAPPLPPVAIFGGDWQVQNDELVQTLNTHSRRKLIFGDPAWSNYDFTFKAMADGDVDGLSAVFHWAPNTAQDFIVGGHGGTGLETMYYLNGRMYYEPAGYQKEAFELHRWHDVRIQIRGTEFRCFLDGQERSYGVDDHFTQGRVGFETWGGISHFRDIRVTAPDGTVLFAGMPPLSTALRVDPSTPATPQPRPAEPQALPVQPTIASRGTLAVLFKGGTLDVFLNGQRIHQSAGEDLRSIPLTLSPGDHLLLRLTSSFYYRSVRCAFIADNPAASFIETAAGTAIRATPERNFAAPATPFDAPAAATGPHDDRQQTLWSDASLPATAEWIALPEANTIYDLAFTVPPVPR
jgi:serine/threonine protein kinase